MNRTLLILTLAGLSLSLAMPGCNLANNKAADREAELAKQERVDALIKEAQDYRAQGLDDSAFAKFGQALIENPRVVEAHVGIGDIYKQRGEYDKAAVRFELAAAIDPKNYDAHYNLGVCKQVLGDLGYAIKSYRKAMKLRPESAEVNRGLASAYLQDNRSGLALAYAERATKLDPESFSAWANLGFIYGKVKRYTEAVDAFRSASELAGKDDAMGPVLLGLADAHLKLRNYTRATNVLNAVIKTDPTSTAYERLGVAMFKQRKYEDALKHFKKANELDPRDTSALNGLGVAYMTLYIEGKRSNPWQRDQAIKAWSRSLDLKPGQQSIVTLITRYKNI